MTFLVVDDSPTMRRIICNSLIAIGHDEIVEAEDGEKALEALSAVPVDFVLTDWNMPNMNGLALTKRIRQHPTLKDLPVVMITTRGMHEDVIAALHAQINSYIVKPFTPGVLREKIDAVMQAA